MKPASVANLWLLALTVGWGLTFVLIQAAVKQLDPNVFVGMRLLTASLVLLPLAGHQLIWKRQSRGISREMLFFSLLLGAFIASVYFAQTIGLKTISPARSAFITGFSVVLVPLLQPLFKLKKPSRIEFVSAFLCLAGLFVLTGASFGKLGIGDYWTFLCAFLYAISILSLQVLSPRFPQQLLFTFLQLSLATPLIFLTTIGHSYAHLFSAASVIAILFCGLLVTGGGIFIQVKYQQQTTATKAALIYMLEPVFTSIFSVLFFHQMLSADTIIGGAIIVGSLMLSSGIYPERSCAKRN